MIKAKTCKCSWCLNIRPRFLEISDILKQHSPDKLEDFRQLMMYLEAAQAGSDHWKLKYEMES